MIKHLIFLFLTLFFIALAKPAIADHVTARACTPGAGYDSCYSYTLPGLFTVIKSGMRSNMQSCLINGVNSWCARKEFKMAYSCDGGGGEVQQPTRANIKLYGADQDFSCSENSCSSLSTLLASESNEYNNASTNGETVVFTSPKQFSSLTLNCLFNPEKDVTGTDSWIYGGVRYNFTLDSKPTNVYVVNCMSAYDCEGGYQCDQSGSWETWRCVPPPFNFSLSNSGETFGVVGGSVDSTITVNNTATGSIPREVSLTTTASSEWIDATTAAEWARREDHTSLVFDNKMWVMGGQDSTGAYKNDVWYSTDGATWTQATANAGWSGRTGHTTLTFNNKMWVMGGVTQTSVKNDVWYSTDGATWTQATANAGWSGRGDHTSLVFDNKLWVLGGNASGAYKNDVWYSTDGVTWTQATANAGWTIRQKHTALTFNNKMWLMGGSTTGYKKDVWYSTDGATWTQATDNAAWGSRDNHTSLVFDNKMWVLGGHTNSGSKKNDVWYSIDGVTWTQATANAAWAARSQHTSLTFSNKMWVMGGYIALGGRSNDVWSYQPTTVFPSLTLSPTRCTPNTTCESTLTATIPPGATTSRIKVDGTDGTSTKSTTFRLTVDAEPCEGTLSVVNAPSRVNPGNSVTTTISGSLSPSCNGKTIRFSCTGPATCTIPNCILSSGRCTSAFNAPSNLGIYSVTASINGTSVSPVSRNFTVASGTLTSGSCGSGTAKATGLVTTPLLTGEFGTTGGCILDPKAAFAPFRIPDFNSLKSLYFDQSKLPKSGTNQQLYAISTPPINLNDRNKVYFIDGDLNIDNPADITGSQTGVIFVNGDLNIGPTPSNKLQYGSATSGLVFVVKEDIIIDPTITQIDAILISEGTIYTAGAGCAPSSITTSPLIINGSLISINQTTSTPAIKFCRTLSGTQNSTIAAEKINHQIKYLPILRGLLSDTYQKWSEVEGSITLPAPAAPASTPTTPTTYTIASGYSSTQGPRWYYYYRIGTATPQLATYGTAQMQAQAWFGQPDNVYWNAGSSSWMWVDPNMNTPGDSQIALIYWKAPAKGSATMTITEKRIEDSGKGNGFIFGAGYVSTVGSYPFSLLNSTNVPSTDLSTKTISVTQQMNGDGDALMYFKNSNSSTFGDAANYTIDITFTPN